MAKLGGGIPLIYMHTQISTGNAICNATVPPLGGAACKPLSDAKTHADSRVMDANMSEVYYTKCAGGSDLLTRFISFEFRGGRLEERGGLPKRGPYLL